MGYNAATQRISSTQVGIRDVQLALGNASTDLMTLCRASNINIWSRWKPTLYASRDVTVGYSYNPEPTRNTGILISDLVKYSPTQERTYGLGTWGINFPNLDVVSAWVGANNGYTYYSHDYPTGTGSFYARLKDFHDYSHGQPSPFGNPIVTWNGRTFTCSVPLNWDAAFGILPSELDWCIYQYVAWKPMLMVDNGSYVGIYASTVDSSKPWLHSLVSTDAQLVFTDTVGTQGVNYTFTPMLVAFKYIEQSGYPDGNYVKVQQSAGNNSYCGIPMPNSKVTSMSGGNQPTITVMTLVADSTYPSSSIERAGMQGAESYLYVTVRYYGGDSGFNFTNPQINAVIGGAGTRLSANDVYCSAGQTLDKQYCFGVPSLGTILCQVTASCGTYSGYKQEYLTFS